MFLQVCFKNFVQGALYPIKHCTDRTPFYHISTNTRLIICPPTPHPTVLPGICSSHPAMFDHMNFTGIYRFDVSWLSGVARLFPVVENMVQRKCYTAELQPGWRTGNKSGYFHTIQKVGRPSYEWPPFFLHGVLQWCWWKFSTPFRHKYWLLHHRSLYHE